MAASREPQNISKTDWYYEMPNHLLIVHEVHNANGYYKTDQFKIPWKMIERSRKRRPKPRKR